MKPALIQFQQFPTFVKRKLEGTNYHEPEEASSSNQDNEIHLNPDANGATFTVDDEVNDAPTWETKIDTTNRETQDTWGGASTTKQIRHNSPDPNAYRSGVCTYCDCSIGSKRMHGPLICYECRIFLKEDKEHEKEQQAYEDRRQAKYKAQIAGDNDMTQIDKEATDKAAKHTNDGHTYEVLPSPSPPRDLPQYFTRISIAKLLQNRKDGQIQQRTKHTIFPHPNPITYLQEIQDPPPIPR
jgi:hypothetical protein